MSLFSFLSFNERIKKKKDRIRADIRERKIATSKEQKNADSIAVFDQIEQMEEFINAEVVLLYWSTRSELPTHDFIQKWSFEKTFLLPTVHGKKMNMKRFISYDNLVEGERKIKEPKTEEYTGKVDLAIIPGIAFDNKKNRMGRGKGYYDRFLAEMDIPAYGVCFDFQLLKKVPTQRTDIKMDKVITPDRIIE